MTSSVRIMDQMKINIDALDPGDLNLRIVR